MNAPNGRAGKRYVAVKRYVAPEFAQWLDEQVTEVNRNLRAMNRDLISGTDVTRILALNRPQIIVRLPQKKRGLFDDLI
jgi:hypothetical protein